MSTEKTSIFANSLIWFGAGVSIAEILTGTLLAPLGFAKGLTAILIGHLIGGGMMYAAGLIGGETGKSAMETVKISFGSRGSLLFSSLNVLQLLGWTAVMIISGAAAAQAIWAWGTGFWSAAIGVLIALWIIVDISNLGKLNLVTMAALFLLTIVLSTVVFGGSGTAAGVSGAVAAGAAGEAAGASEAAAPALSFGGAIELAVAMPLSWLPLISDYTRTAAEPKRAAACSCLTYGLVSCWMYVIGMGAAVLTGESDIAKVMLQAGLGLSGIIIVLFSTVTTTFLDAYSAGISSESVSAGLNGKYVALAVCAVGTLIAVLAPGAQLEEFLYLISSVFAPMTAVLITDYYFLKADHSAEEYNWQNLLLWAVGFGVYRVFLKLDTPVGNTVPVMIITMLLCLVVKKVLVHAKA